MTSPGARGVLIPLPSDVSARPSSEPALPMPPAPYRNPTLMCITLGIANSFLLSKMSYFRTERFIYFFFFSIASLEACDSKKAGITGNLCFPFKRRFPLLWSQGFQAIADFLRASHPHTASSHSHGEPTHGDVRRVAPSGSFLGSQALVQAQGCVCLQRPAIHGFRRSSMSWAGHTQSCVSAR